MILNYLPEAQLQEAVGTTLLQRLEQLGPLVLGNDADPVRLYRKASLLKVISSFGPSDRMRDPAFLHGLLNVIPEEALNRIVRATGVSHPLESFASKRDKLVKKGWTDPDYCRRFAEAAGLPEIFLPAVKVQRASSESVEPLGRPFKRLKNYQQSVYERALAELSPPRARIMVQMPTGSGKTRTAMEIVADVLSGEAVQTTTHAPVVVWIAHAEELCEQCIECFRDVWSHIGGGPCQLVRVYGEHALPDVAAHQPTFIVAGFQKLSRILETDDSGLNRLARVARLLVIDEAHKVLAPTYLRVAEELIGPGTRVMGLTATPGRNATDHEQNRRLADFFFGRVVPLAALGEESVFAYLRRIGVMSRARLEPLATSPSIELTARQRRQLEVELDYPAGVLEALGKDDVRNVEIIKRLKTVCASDKRVLFFACSVEHSKFICAVLIYLGIKAAHVDGESATAQRTAAIRGFKGGEIQVMCNYGILATGFDAPKTDVVFVARPTKSVVLYSQMIGRGLRGPAIGGTATCLLVNVVDNIVGLPDNDAIYGYFDEYWDA